MLKTHVCGELTAAHVDQRVTLAGWVNRRRDHGGLIFIDLRDSRGLVQVVFNPEQNAAAHAVASEMRPEFVVRVTGRVARRRPGTENRELPTGEIEVVAQEAAVLNPSRTPPFYIYEDGDVGELMRLRYRYLDLRRAGMRDRMWARYRAVRFIRNFLHERGFIEIETPILANPTPEGARDYLVPSRVQKGSFYALPQSPQQFKQLLMVAGFERYFQIARCFRDEDFRADRQVEHTQLDLEMSFVSDEEDILGLMEELYAGIAREVAPAVRVKEYPFPRITFGESLRRFGTDKPDLRYGMELIDLSEAAVKGEFGVFKQALAAGGQVRGICVEGGVEKFARKQIDDLTRFSQEAGARGLVSIGLLGEGSVEALTEDDVRSPVAKHLGVECVRAMAKAAGASRGDLLLVVADKPKVVNAVLGALRRDVARRLDLAEKGVFAFVFLKDVPMFEWNETEGRWDPLHHPFTSPREEDLPLMDSDPGAVRSRAYDLVCNGWEMFSGSIRIHRRDLQEKVFALLGIGSEEARRKFGHMLDAFEFGAPPHAGIGAGIDRMMAALLDQPDIREVITFPKTKAASDPMTGAPSPVDPAQLDELGIALKEPPQEE